MRIHAALVMSALLFSSPAIAVESDGHFAVAANDADNTGRNERDREGTTVTPMDQGESAGDLAITQQIRKAVVANDALSTNAQNVKIITRDGVVTLRGPVKTVAEKVEIGSLASKASGVKQVDNQIEIETND